MNRLNPFRDKALSESETKATITIYIVKPLNRKKNKKSLFYAYFLFFFTLTG